MTPAHPGSDQPRFDVVICGAGLAGLTLARQLRREQPRASVALLDRLSRPLRRAAFKVGEATTEVGAYYLSDILGLGEYLDQHHLRKLGLRLFFSDGVTDFARRPEAGVPEFSAPYAYTLDRGLLEQDLREGCVDLGVTLLEGCRVDDIELADADAGEHRIRYRLDGVAGELRARWVVDGMGRRRFLQRKLGLAQPCDPRYNAVWFRIAERVDVADLVPASECDWHARVPDRQRWFSTNHLCGRGYWVWLIALPGNYTSIGIVSDGEIHDFRGMTGESACRTWLDGQEPALAARLRDSGFVDFATRPAYSYFSDRVISERRWASIGDAAMFADPLYGTGTDLIGFANGILVQLIERDLDGQLAASEVDELNRFLVTYNRGLADNIRGTYACFDHSTVGAFKVLWDTLAGWVHNAPLMLHGIYLSSAERARFRKSSARFFFLGRRMQKLFEDWSRQTQRRVCFEYLDFFTLPFFRAIRGRNLNRRQADQELIDYQRQSIEFFEELAQVIFLWALADSRPEALERLDELPAPLWLNAWGIDLDPARWERTGLLQPRTGPRDLEPIMKPLTAIFKAPELDLDHFVRCPDSWSDCSR